MELEYIIKVIAPYLIHSLELIGMFIIAVGTVKSFYKYLKTIANPDKNKIKIDFAESVALALDYKLASEIINTVITKRMQDLIVLGAIILIRVILTVVLQWKIQNDKKNKQGTQAQQNSQG